MRGWEHVTSENLAKVLAPPKAAPPLEREIQKAIFSYLVYRGHVVTRFNNIPMSKPDGQKIPVRQPGVSDLLGCQKGTGRFFALEVKRPGGKASAAQETFLASVLAAGGIAALVSSLNDVQQLGL